MNELIAIAVTDLNGETVPTVNARDLHRFLEVGKDFSNWIKAQIERGRLVEGRDYVTFQVSAQKGENLLAQKGEQDNYPTKHGGHNRTEYALTLEAAKHIGMMSGTEKGFEVREYFIACEKLAKAPPAALNPANLSRLQLIEMAMQAEQERLALEAVVSEAKPKAAFYDAFLNAEGLYGLQNAARALGLKPNMFIQWLKTKYLFYQGSALVPYVQFRHLGIFDVKTTVVDDKKREQTYITPKGLAYLNARVPTNVRLSSIAGDNQHDLAV